MLRLSLVAVALWAVFAPSPLRAAAPPVDARLEKAKTLYDSGQYDEAVALCREVLADSPENPAATAELMRLLYAKGESEEVVKLGEAFVGKAANVPAEAYVALGGAYEALKDLEKGGVTYRDGTLRHPAHANLHLRFGVNRMQVLSIEEARLAFVESLKLEPRNSSAWLYLARACQELRLPRYALLAYGHFLVLEPTTPRSSRPAQAFTSVVASVNAVQGTEDKKKVKKAAARSAVASFPEELDNALKALRTTGDKLEDAFWPTCALAYFEDARKARHLEAAAYQMRQSLNEPEVASWIGSHRPATSAFHKWSQAWAGKGCRLKTK